MSSSGRRCPGWMVTGDTLGAVWDRQACVGLWTCLRGDVAVCAVCWAGVGLEPQKSQAL